MLIKGGKKKKGEREPLDLSIDNQAQRNNVKMPDSILEK